MGRVWFGSFTLSKPIQGSSWLILKPGRTAELCMGGLKEHVQPIYHRKTKWRFEKKMADIFLYLKNCTILVSNTVLKCVQRQCAWTITFINILTLIYIIIKITA